MSPTDLKYQKMAAEEKDIRALLRRDFSASRMSATKWQEAVETLRGLPVGYCVKFVDVDHPLEGGLSAATDRYFDSRWGPVLILAVEWLDIDPVEEVGAGLLLKPKRVDHTREIEKRLGAVGVPYTQAGACIRITGHVRNGGTA